MSETTTLDEDLQQLARSLEALIDKEPDTHKKDQLRKQLDKIYEAIQNRVKLNVKQATAEYRQAREGVEQASGEVSAAIQDLAKVAETINTIAKVVETLGKLAAAAAP